MNDLLDVSKVVKSIGCEVDDVVVVIEEGDTSFALLLFVLALISADEGVRTFWSHQKPEDI